MSQRTAALLAVFAIVCPVAAGSNDDPLPQHALARLGWPRLRHGGRIVGLAYLAEGKTIVSAGWDGVVRVWDTADGRELQAWQDPDRDLLLGVVAAPDGRTVLAATRIGVHCWDASAARKTPVSTPIDVSCVALAADARMLAVGGPDGRITLLDPTTGKTIRQWNAHKARIGGLAFSPDGKRLLSGGADRSVRTWAVDTGQELRSREWPGPVGTVTWCKDGRFAALTTGDWLAGKPGRAVHLLRADTLADDRRLDGPDHGVCCAAFAPDGGTIAAGGEGGSIQLWDVASGKPGRRLDGHAAAVLSVAFAPDGKTVASAGADSTVRLWDVQAGRERLAGTGHRAPITAVAAGPRGQVVTTAGGDKSVRVWELPGGRESRTPLRLGSSAPLAVQFTAARELAVAVDRLFLIDLATGQDRQPSGPFGPTLWPNGAFASGGRLLAAAGRTFGRRAGLGVFEVLSGRTVRWLDDSPEIPSAVAISGDGRVVAAGDLTIMPNAGGHIFVWNVAAGGKPRRWEADADQAAAAALTPDGRVLATNGRGGTTILWDPTTGRRLADLAGHDGEVTGLTFSPDGRHLAVGAETGAVQVWEMASRSLRQSFHGHVGPVPVAAFSAGGRILVTGGEDTTGVVWDLTGGAVGPVSPADFERIWADLAGEAPIALAAVWRLAGGAEPAVALLADRLAPTAPPDQDQLARWLAALDSPRFADRTAAAARLSELAERAEPSLRKALVGPVSVEQRRQIDGLLKRLEGPPPTAVLQQIRAVEALERSATPEARRLLQRLAGGADSRLTREAKAAIGRQSADTR